MTDRLIDVDALFPPREGDPAVVAATESEYLVISQAIGRIAVSMALNGVPYEGSDELLLLKYHLAAAHHVLSRRGRINRGEARAAQIPIGLPFLRFVESLNRKPTQGEEDNGSTQEPNRSAEAHPASDEPAPGVASASE